MPAIVSRPDAGRYLMLHGLRKSLKLMDAYHSACTPSESMLNDCSSPLHVTTTRNAAGGKNDKIN
jgi:hypothetical protein